MSLVIILLGLAFIVCYKLFGKRTTNGGKLPPGPIGLPIFGHLPLLGTEPYKTFLKWKAYYGPVIFVRFGSVPTVVLTDDKIIKECFSQNAVADRPSTEFFSQISRGHKGFIFGLAETAMAQRQFVLRNLHDFGLGRSTMEEKITTEVNQFMNDLEDEVLSMGSEEKPILMNDRFKASVINSFWSIFMSKKFERSDPKFDAMIKASHCAMGSAGILGEMGFFMPWLAKFIPRLSGLEKKMEGFHQVYNFAEVEIKNHNKTRIPNNSRDFTDAYLDKVDSTTDAKSSFHRNKNFQPITTGDIFFGALDTTSTALEWLIIQLVHNPDVQEKIFEEVTRVTSQNSRTPGLHDRKVMPYTDAVTHELLRVNTVGPLGLLYCTLDDTTIQDYMVPKGTMVIANLYGIHHDPENFEEPDVFRPERFLEEYDGCLRLRKNVEGYLPFSYGKRFCLGKSQAMDTIFLFTASLVQKFIFGCWANEMPSLQMNNGMVLTPNQFRVKVVIREN